MIVREGIIYSSLSATLDNKFIFLKSDMKSENLKILKVFKVEYILFIFASLALLFVGQ